jgi:hypothetical protein
MVIIRSRIHMSLNYKNFILLLLKLLLGNLSQEILEILALQRVCASAVVERVADLAALRFCTYIEGSLTLVVSDPAAVNEDYSAFQCLEEVRGSKQRIFSPGIEA